MENFQKDHGYNQSIGIYEDDYIEGDGQNYEGVIFTDGATEVVYFSQLDELWKNEPYGSDKIGTHACGSTAMSIVVSSLAGETVDGCPILSSEYLGTALSGDCFLGIEELGKYMVENTAPK